MLDGRPLVDGHLHAARLATLRRPDADTADLVLGCKAARVCHLKLPA